MAWDMATVICTRRLENLGPTASANYPGSTVGEVLSAMQTDYPRLRSYVLDDQGGLRKHVALFADNQLLPRRTALSYPLHESSELFIMQALSGG